MADVRVGASVPAVRKGVLAAGARAGECACNAACARKWRAAVHTQTALAAALTPAAAAAASAARLPRPGGTSLLTQMRERLELDVSAAAPGGTKVKVTAPVNPTERRHAVWIGAHHAAGGAAGALACLLRASTC